MDNSQPMPLPVRILIVAVLIGFPLIFFYPAVLGQVTLAPGDGWTQIYGIRILVGEMIRQGYLPLWNPLIFGGSPLLAGLQPAALYPPTYLFAILSPKAAMNVMVITTYHLALIGTYLYARRIRMNWVGALIAGLGFTFSGYMVVHLGHTSRVATAAWLPWLLLAFEHLYQRVQWRWIALGSFFLALQTFAGEPQMNFYSYLVAGAYGLFSLFLREERERRFRYAAAVVVMCACGAMLSMIQLLPARELLKLGERVAIDYDYFSGYSLAPKQALNLLIPYFFGGAAGLPYRMTYWGEWNPAETIGYLGLIPLLMGIVALVGARNRMTVFWALVALISLLLTFGDNLPFGAYRMMYKIPVYNLFRASGRNLFEFSFALSVLAGLGVTALASLERRKAKRVLSVSLVIFAALWGSAAVLYLFFTRQLAFKIQPPVNAGSVKNLEFLLPLLFFILTGIGALLYARRGSALAGALLVLVLFADNMSWGRFFEWMLVSADPTEKLREPASVKFIKERETDLNSFRFLSHSWEPFGRNTDLLNYPNFPITRGLQCLNGYDPLRLESVAAVAGALTLDGYVMQKQAFDPNHRGFDLFNVRYLLRENEGRAEPIIYKKYEDVKFSERPMDLRLEKGGAAALNVRATATEIAFISELGDSTDLPDDTPVLTIVLYTADGGVIERSLMVGRHTSEWAYDREDVKAAIKHKRAAVVESWPEAGFSGHRFLGRVAFDRAEIVHIDLKFSRETAGITIEQISLYDATTGASRPLDTLYLSPDRWRELANWGEVTLYENLKALPRAWFVRNAALAPSAEVLEIIKTGKMKDGTSFDPAETVLLESELFPPGRTPWPSQVQNKGEARVVRYEPNRIELSTKAPEGGVLVLSETYYRGWEALIDGARTPVERVDYALRGVVVPAGEHRVEFRFRSPSIRKGAVLFAFAIVILGLGAWFRPLTERTSASGPYLTG